MPLDKKHYLPNKKDRELTPHFHPIYKLSAPNKKEFDRVEKVLDEVTCDVVNGLPKSDIMLKLMNGEYENQNKGVHEDRAREYYNAVMSRMELDNDGQIENARNVFSSMYLNLYKECLEIGNHIGAKAALDSLVKLMGLDKPTNQTNIQVNNSSQGLTINFGINDN